MQQSNLSLSRTAQQWQKKRGHCEEAPHAGMHMEEEGVKTTNHMQQCVYPSLKFQQLSQKTLQMIVKNKGGYEG